MNDVNAMRQRVAKYLIPVFILSVLFNVPKFLEAEIEYLKAEEDYGHSFGNISDYYNESNTSTDQLFNDKDQFNEVLITLLGLFEIFGRTWLYQVSHLW